MKNRKNFKCTLYYSIFRESAQALKKIFLEKKRIFPLYIEYKLCVI